MATLRHTFDVAFWRWSADTFLEKFGLRMSDSLLSFLAHFLQQGLELALFQRPDQGRVIGLDLKFIDRDGQFHPTVELDHFSVLQDLLASICQFLPGSQALYFFEISQQRFKPAEFTPLTALLFAGQLETAAPQNGN